MKLAPEERRRRILDRLSAGSLSIPDIVREFDISPITARRDLAALEKDGRLMRVHGGALQNDRVAYEFTFKEKESRNRSAKEAIGRAAAALVTPGDAVYLDTGTTSLAVARALRACQPSVIITINLCVASEYVGQKDIRVLVPGGEVGQLSPDLQGEWTLQMLRDVTVDIAFLGGDSVDTKDGYSAADPKSGAISRLILERSSRSYLVADSSKFGARSLYRIAPLNRLTGLVTDSGVSMACRAEIEKLGLDLIVADV